ncbi:MAG TPA: hypothetical protein VII06_29275 [Chloroflexota bacterium]|jgi:hypothetical protein
MDIVKASTMWAGPRNDLLQVFVEPTPTPWGVTWDDLPDDLDDEFVVFRELDANEEPTGRVAGIEILDFLRFDRWDAVPRFPLLWQVPGQEPLPLVDLLKRLQPELRERARLADAAAHSQAAE